MELYKKYSEPFASLFDINMGVRPGERIVVFTDRPGPGEFHQALSQIAEAAANFALERYGNASFVCYPSTQASGAEPPVELWQAVLGKQITAELDSDGLLARLLAKSASVEELARAREIVINGRAETADVVVALAFNSTSHTRFRSLVNAAGGRFASLPHFDPEMFFTSMKVDWMALAERTARLTEAMRDAVEIHLTTPNGTRMTFGCQGRTAAGDNGLLTSPGSFGNLPAGEVYLAPLEGTSCGEMVLEYAPTRKLTSQIRLIVDNGEVKEIIGDEPYTEHLREAFSKNSLTRNIAELGIGTNDSAKNPENILEAEKILGTVHVALGDNSGFGGNVQVPFHEDYLFYEPTLTLTTSDGSVRTLLKQGKMLF